MTNTVKKMFVYSTFITELSNERIPDEYKFARLEAGKVLVVGRDVGSPILPFKKSFKQ